MENIRITHEEAARILSLFGKNSSGEVGLVLEVNNDPSATSVNNEPLKNRSIGENLALAIRRGTNGMNHLRVYLKPVSGSGSTGVATYETESEVATGKTARVGGLIKTVYSKSFVLPLSNAGSTTTPHGITFSKVLFVQAKGETATGENRIDTPAVMVNATNIVYTDNVVDGELIVYVEYVK